MKTVSRLLLALLLLGFSACGGGGGDDGGGPQVSKEFISVTPNVQLLAEGQTQSVSVSANCQWTVTKSTDASWLTVSPTSGSNDATINVTAGANTSTDQRTAILTIKGSARSVTVTVTQAGLSSTLSVNKTSLSFAATGGSETFNISSNDSWSITAPSWCSVSPRQSSGNATITVTTAANNTSSALSGNIVVSGKSNSQTITVSQATAQMPVVSNLSVANITSTSAECSFSVSSEVSVTSCGICYSSSSATPTTTDSKVEASSISSNATVFVSLSSLQPNTNYHIRAYATNAIGTAYSNVVTITTQKRTPGEGDNPTPAKKNIL